MEAFYDGINISLTLLEICPWLDMALTFAIFVAVLCRQLQLSYDGIVYWLISCFSVDFN